MRRHLRTAAAIGLAAGCALLPAARGDDGDQPASEERPSQSVIDAAVERGVAWLRKEQTRTGAFGTSAGETALSLLALRHSGVPAEDRTCRRAAAHLERDLPDGTVYGAGLGVLALLAQDRELHRSKIESLVEDLVDAQCVNGQWSYTYRGRRRGTAGDNSNTQFALLALAAARARGLDVPTAPFRRCREFFAETQNEDGGWGYSAKERSASYASMTAGGVMCLAFAKSAEDGLPAGAAAVAADPVVARAVRWLDEHFDPEANTGAARAFGSKRGKRNDGFWRHYWLWSLERGAAALGAERIGRHDWYTRGARVLLEGQRPDGGWRNPERQVLATCFALLFFGRSTRIAITPRDSERPAVTPSGPRPPDPAPEPGRAETVR